MRLKLPTIIAFKTSTILSKMYNLPLIFGPTSQPPHNRKLVLPLHILMIKMRMYCRCCKSKFINYSSSVCRLKLQHTSLTTHTTRTSFHPSSSFDVFGSSSLAGVTIPNKVSLWTTILCLVLKFFPQKIQLNQRPI